MKMQKAYSLALRCRPDVLLAESFLTSRVSKPTVEDWKKLESVLMYLNGTRQLGFYRTAGYCAHRRELRGACKHEESYWLFHYHGSWPSGRLV